METLVLINKKNRPQNEGFMEGEEGTSDEATVDRDVMERARAAGINPGPILEDIVNAVRNVNSSNPDGVCTDLDVEQIKRTLLEKVQQILSKYRIDGIEIGSYPDPYATNGYAEVQLFLASSGHLYERYHDGRTQDIELSSYVLEDLRNPKHILRNLFERLIEMTEKNKAKIKEIEEFANDFSLSTVRT
jgi:hypothetical protein